MVRQNEVDGILSNKLSLQKEIKRSILYDL